MDYILEKNIDIVKKQIYCDDGITLCPYVDVDGKEGKEFTKAVEYVIKRVIDYDETIVDYFRDEDEMLEDVMLSYQDLLKYLRTECVTKTTLKKFIKYHLSSESHKDTKELLERLL